MTTVKDVKNGAELPQPIYVTEPYVVFAKNERVVMHAGTRQTIVDLCSHYGSYYDDCPVEVRQYDLYLTDNTRLSEITELGLYESAMLAMAND